MSDLQAFGALQQASGSVTGNPSGALSFCDYQLAPGIGIVNSSGGPAGFGIGVAVGGNYCKWAASTGANWVTFTSATTGPGAGAETLSASPLTTGLARAAIVIVGDQLYRVIEGPSASSGGTGTGPTTGGPGGGGIATLSTSVVNFGNELIGDTSVPTALSLINTGTAPLDIASILVGGPFSETNTCPQTIAVGAICQISVIFTQQPQVHSLTL